MYKGLSLLPFSQFCTLSNVTTTRGHTAEIAKKRCQRDLRRFFFSERVIDKWNRAVYNRFNAYRRFMNGLERTNELHRWASSRTSGPPGPMASHALQIRLGAGAAKPGMLPRI